MSNIKNSKIHLEIVTPYGMFYENDVEHLILPSTDGEFGIWPGHTPVIIALNPGEVRMKDSTGLRMAAISDGYADIESDQAIVVVGSAEWPGDIDCKRAQEALTRAIERMNDPQTTRQEAVRSRRSILRAKARLKVCEHSKDPYE